MMLKLVSPTETVLLESIEKFEIRHIVFVEMDTVSPDDGLQTEERFGFYYPELKEGYFQIDCDNLVEEWSQVYPYFSYHDLSKNPVLTRYCRGKEKVVSDEVPILEGLEIHFSKSEGEYKERKALIVSNDYKVYILNNQGTTIDVPKFRRYNYIEENR